MAYRYADLQRILHVVHGFQDSEVFGTASDDGQRGDRIQSRLKMFRRAEFPTSARFIRGPGASYTLDDVMQLTIAMALMEEGLNAALAARIVRTNWERALERAIGEAYFALEQRDDSLLLVVQRTTFDGFGVSDTAAAWHWLSFDAERAHQWDAASQVDILWSDAFFQSDLFKPRCKEPLPFGGHHALILNISKLVDALVHILPELGLATRDELQALFKKSIISRA